MHLLLPFKTTFAQHSGFFKEQNTKLEEGKVRRSEKGRNSGLLRLVEDMGLMRSLQVHSCLGHSCILDMREVKYLEALKAQVQLLKIRPTETVDELRQKDL